MNKPGVSYLEAQAPTPKQLGYIWYLSAKLSSLIEGELEWALLREKNNKYPSNYIIGLSILRKALRQGLPRPKTKKEASQLIEVLLLLIKRRGDLPQIESLIKSGNVRIDVSNLPWLVEILEKLKETVKKEEEAIMEGLPFSLEV